MLGLVEWRTREYISKIHGVNAQNWTIAYNALVTIAAVGGVAAAVFSHGAARANWLAGIGIGAGAAATTWSWSNPGAVSDAYRLGTYRAVCLRVAAAGLDNDDADAAIKAQITTVENAEKDVKTAQQDSTFAKELKSTVAATAVAATRAQDSVATALAQADAALQAANAEHADYQQRSVTVYGALQKIDLQLYASVKGAPIDYAATFAALSKAAAASAASAASGTKAAAPVAPIAHALAAATGTAGLQQKLADLTLATAALAAMKPFSTSVTQVNACTSASP